MKIEIRQIEHAEEKRTICRAILEALPEWFGIPEAREEYIRESADRLFFAAMDGEKPVGFLYLKETGRDTVELYAMGVLKARHRTGVGRALVEAARRAAREAGYAFMAMSAATHQGTRELVQAIAARLAELPPVAVYEPSLFFQIRGVTFMPWACSGIAASTSSVASVIFAWPPRASKRSTSTVNGSLVGMSAGRVR